MKQVFFSKNPVKCGMRSLETFKLPADRLTHEYRSSPEIEKAASLLRSLISDSVAWFRSSQGEDFDRYDLSHGAVMKPRMWNDERMREALHMLGLPQDQVQKLYLPWWNEIAGSETGMRLEEGGVHAVLGARHTYQSQMMRQGLDIPGICSVSVAGFVHTSDDRLVIGLRGGANFPNTYYFSAGALAMAPLVQSGGMQIYRFFLNEELRKEYGMMREDVSKAELLCKVVLEGADRDTSYVFVTYTPLPLSQVLQRYASNNDPDKKEHNGLEGIRPDEVTSFVREFYKGTAINDQKRTFEQRVLLPQGAGPLLLYSGADLSLMDELAK